MYVPPYVITHLPIFHLSSTHLVLGQQRFALPRCLALTGEGAPCRPGNAPFNTTLYYLSRDSVDFINVWHDLCPCSFGLVCSRDSGVCELPSFHVNNLLDEDQWEED
ncbi:astakine-like [Diaphorina citri]|uniref:Astakine-like n=1 Tax=Diaphorina citri TaxID=121845 RepID=A0A1S4ESN0_DIACI|nr:astakine-like [Diaphorina citri]